MKKTVLAVVAVISLIRVCAGGEQLDAPIDRAAIKNFFEEFSQAFNAKDAERVRKMSGKTWDEWADDINGEEKIREIDILDIATSGTTNVSTKFTVVYGDKKTCSTDVIFTMRKFDGLYFIDKMAVPEVDNMNFELDSAFVVLSRFTAAINEGEWNSVRQMLTFGDVKDFEAELSSRGLTWIKSIIEAGVRIPEGNNMSVQRDSGRMIGYVEIPCGPGGTNVLHEVIFKGLKIDRAAPRRETYEEFCERIKAEQKADRKQYEAKRAAEYKRQNAEARERLIKELKDIGALK